MKRDLRAYARQTNFRLIIGGILLIFIVGDGLICIIYGREAAIMGLVCLMIGLSPIFLVWLSLTIIGLIVKRANND